MPTHLFNALVLNFERKLVDLLTPQERGVASLRDTHLTKHLAYDHFDVLIINRHTLKAVHLLNLIHKKCLQLLWSENIQYIMRQDRAFGKLLPLLHKVALKYDTVFTDRHKMLFFLTGIFISENERALAPDNWAEIHDAIKRRCFYFWVDYPDARRELEILKVKVPDAPEKLTQQVVDFVQHLRNRDLFKLPGVAETIDWTNALIQLDKIDLDPETVNSSLGVLLKYQDDIEKIQGSEAAQILDEVKAGIAAGN